MVLVIRDASLALSPLLHQNKNDGGEREILNAGRNREPSGRRDSSAKAKERGF